MRGRLWKTFLRGGNHAEPGVYESLVSQALAPQYQNSKVQSMLRILQIVTQAGEGPLGVLPVCK